MKSDIYDQKCFGIYKKPSNCYFLAIQIIIIIYHRHYRKKFTKTPTY